MTPRGEPERAARRLAELSAGTTAATALAFFDELPAIDLAGVLGRWRGSGLPTGSPLDGLLEAYGWYGKEFIDAERVHPLLFGGRGGPRPIDPALIPIAVLRDRPAVAHSAVARTAFAVLKPLLRTAKPRARLRTVEHRGVSTAAMVYDALPIIDVFRRITADRVLGLMDLRGLTEPFFFLLDREPTRA
jgi:Domain of unknown function (DUF4334)/GXWXG protein